MTLQMATIESWLLYMSEIDAPIVFNWNCLHEDRILSATHFI